MTKSPDLTGNPSRRRFTKSIAAALATIPLVPSSISTRELWPAKLTSLRASLATLPLNLAINHMPPLIIRSSSLEIEAVTELFNNDTCDRGPCRFTEKKINGCYVYGIINRIYINDDLGKSIYAEEVVGEWEIKLLLQKLTGINSDGSLQHETQVPATQHVIIRPLAEGSFEIVVEKDLGRASKDKKRKLNRYRTLINYKISEFNDKKFRIGQVTVKNNGSDTNIPPKLEEPNEFAKNGFVIHILFNDVPGCDERVFLKGHKGFWEHFRKIFRRR
ncbi:MAG: hypothetical protein M3R15_01035 [Acidobacteriota bacterium]|nr:hypothetical protein [Acidobacteriota bacterium]